jgi:hypothetical protein
MSDTQVGPGMTPWQAARERLEHDLGVDDDPAGSFADETQADDVSMILDALAAREAELAEVKAERDAAVARARAAEAATDTWRRRYDDTTETLWQRAKAAEVALAARDIDLAVGVDENVRFARARADKADATNAALTQELARKTTACELTRMGRETFYADLQTVRQELARLREALVALRRSTYGLVSPEQVRAIIDAALARAPQEGATQPTEGPTL